MSDDYALDPAQWPPMPAVHRAFLEYAILRFQADPRLAGVAAGGSFIGGRLDEHSDLDLVVQPAQSEVDHRPAADVARHQHLPLEEVDPRARRHDRHALVVGGERQIGRAHV